MDTYDIIIIGAGISGLSLARFCGREGLKTLVLEKSGRTGGTLHSHRTSGTAEGFWIEMGAHTCYNSYRNLLGIIDECGIRDSITPRRSVPFVLLDDDAIKSIPSQIDFLELLLSAPRLFTLKKEGLSVRAYYSKIVGQKNYARVFGPAFNAVISQEAGDFPADILFKKRERRKDVIRKFTLSGGVQTVTDALASGKTSEVLTGMEVGEAGFDGKFFFLNCGDKTFASSFLAVAAPPPAAARILGGAFPEISEGLAQLDIASVESVGVVVKKEKVSMKPVAGIIPMDDAFYSAVSRDAVPHESFRGFTFHFKPGVTGKDARLNRISDLLHVRPSDFEDVVSKENIVPSPRVGHSRLTEKIDHLLKNKGLLLTGNYFDGLAIEDCVTRSSSEFARLKKML